MPEQVTNSRTTAPTSAASATRLPTTAPTGAVHVIVNPTAGGGRAGRLQTGILRAIADRFGADVSCRITTRPGEATHSACAAVAGGATLVVAVGGDGTIHEVVNGMRGAIPASSTPCELGIVNCGTGSGLAESLQLPAALGAQLDLLASARSATIDVGHVTCRDRLGGRIGRWFVSECQVGIGSVVSASVGPLAKRFGGPVAFGVTALRHTIAYRATRLEVSYDRVRPVSHPLLGLAVGNGSVCAGGMRLTPDARLDDGKLDVLAIHAMSVMKRLRSFPRIYAGTHVHSPSFQVRRCADLRIAADRPTMVSADGEPLGTTPCRITLHPAALRIRGVGTLRS